VDRVVAVGLEFTADDPDAIAAAGRRHADGYAFTFGAMGSSTRNFYNDAFARQGYGDDVAEVQRLWQAGDRAAAAARVPIEIGLGTNLVGPPELVRARLVDYERSGVTTLRVGVDGSFDQKIGDLETLIALAADAGAETATNPTTSSGRTTT
jgi:alkanesulfonate monooxygenase SsuD/methylene tetrahydromethanopterin reductase-like flavin-dependent oxidoreductase (luciferase family)